LTQGLRSGDARGCDNYGDDDDDDGDEEDEEEEEEEKQDVSRCAKV
jgi:hypothetical protein